MHSIKLDNGSLTRQSKVILPKLNTKLHYISKDFSRMVISQNSDAFVYSIDIDQEQIVLSDEDKIETPI